MVEREERISKLESEIESLRVIMNDKQTDAIE